MGCFIAHVEGNVFPSDTVGSGGIAAHPLKDKDVIALAAVNMECSNPSADR